MNSGTSHLQPLHLALEGGINLPCRRASICFTGAACALSCAPVMYFMRGCVCAVAILTVKILAMAEHMKVHRKDFSSRLCAPARCSTLTILSEQ